MTLRWRRALLTNSYELETLRLDSASSITADASWRRVQ